MHTFQEHKLGETEDRVQIETAAHHRLAAIRMAQQARRQIEIVSRDLEPAVYDTPEFVEALKRLALANKRARVRIITFDPQAIVTRGHRLLEVSGVLSSFFELRKGGHEHKDYGGSLFLADAMGYIRRSSSDRYEGELNFRDPRQSRLLLAEFDEMWGKSVPDPNFRRFTI
jgi:hypothetical protein